MRYKFGSNNLFVGIAVQNLLEHFERKYELDFNELMKGKKNTFDFNGQEKVRAQSPLKMGLLEILA